MCPVYCKVYGLLLTPPASDSLVYWSGGLFLWRREVGIREREARRSRLCQYMGIGKDNFESVSCLSKRFLCLRTMAKPLPYYIQVNEIRLWTCRYLDHFTFITNNLRPVVSLKLVFQFPGRRWASIFSHYRPWRPRASWNCWRGLIGHHPAC